MVSTRQPNLDAWLPPHEAGTEASTEPGAASRRGRCEQGCEQHTSNSPKIGGRGPAAFCLEIAWFGQLSQEGAGAAEVTHNPLVPGSSPGGPILHRIGARPAGLSPVGWG